MPPSRGRQNESYMQVSSCQQASRGLPRLTQLIGYHHKISPVDSGAEEDEVGPEHGLDQGQWDGGRLVYHQQLRLAQPLVVLRLHVLHRLRAGTYFFRL